LSPFHEPTLLLSQEVDGLNGLCDQLQHRGGILLPLSGELLDLLDGLFERFDYCNSLPPSPARIC
jgi:hypothetical protein